MKIETSRTSETSIIHGPFARHIPPESAIFIDRGAISQMPVEIRREATLLPGGEACKTWSGLQTVCNHLIARQHERSQPVVAIGGGAVCDAVAFAASIYRRGTPVVLVPTTMLSMVDAAIGGKTAINVTHAGSLYKNSMGSFYPAESILIDHRFLASLPIRERKSGVGELLKASFIADQHIEELALYDFVRHGSVCGSLYAMMHAAVTLKVRIVEADPFENDVRAVLNYGHTAGHVIEALTGASHGESIAWGMAIESALLNAEYADYIFSLLAEMQFAPPPAGLAEARIAAVLGQDKKMQRGLLRTLIVDQPGSFTELKIPVSEFAGHIGFYLREKFRIL